MDNGSPSSMFRQEALLHRGAPEKRGVLPIVHSLSYRIFFWLFGACILLMCAWGIFGRVNETIYGQGIILHGGEYGSLYAQNNGILIALDVQRGDEVHMGQIVGRIFSSSDFEKFLQLTYTMRYQEEIFTKLTERVNFLKEQKEKFTEEDLKRVEACLARMQKQIEWYDNFLTNSVPKLETSGAASKLQVTAWQDDQNERLRDQEDMEAKSFQEKVNLANNLFELENTLLEYEIKVRQARFDAEQKLRSINYNSNIVSYCDGIVANVNVRRGDLVTSGMKVMRVATVEAPSERVWSVRGYFPVGEAAKIHTGMRVGVTPSIVKAERDGSIIGVVTAVGGVLETPESLSHLYQNDSFSDYIFRRCNTMPVEVSILLSCNQDNPSGFNWTSGKGPDVQIAPKTLCGVRVTTGQYSPLQVLFSQLRRFRTGQGMMEDQDGFSIQTLD